jgi:hypothetical protein
MTAESGRLPRRAAPVAKLAICVLFSNIHPGTP